MFRTNIKIPFLGCLLRYTLLLNLLFLDCQGDPPPALTLRSRFGAIIVTDLDATSSWYQSLLKLSVKSKQVDPGGAYRISILTSPDFEMEFLELKGSLSRSSLLGGHPTGTQIQGLFKMGFEVADMDGWISHIKALQISIPQIWTDAKSGKRNFLITDPEGNLIQFFEK